MIPNSFIDDYMPSANGEFVKVYLYLLRCMNSHTYVCSISAIADTLNHTEMDVIRALRYWQKVNLLSLEETPDGQICGIHLLSTGGSTDDAMDSMGSLAPVVSLARTIATPAAAVAPLSAEQTAPAPAVDLTEPKKVSAPDRRKYTADEISAFCRDEDISELIFLVETYLKHTLSENDMNTVLFWHEQLKFPNDLIVYLLEYCISKGHTSMRYMDKVALGWHEKGIDCVEHAKEDAAIHSQAYYGVMKALGITGRSLVDTETAYIRKWTKEYMFDLSIIKEACNRTITATHQSSFEYTDSILTSWYKNNVHTLADVKKLDLNYTKTKTKTKKSSSSQRTAPAPRKNSFTNFSSREYDYDNLEELLLSSSAKAH
jgi:DnaD/phage-associated family protein